MQSRNRIEIVDHVQSYMFLEAVEGRWAFDGSLSRVGPTMRVAPPTVNVGVVGYYKSLERDSCLIASVKKSVMQNVCIRHKVRTYWPGEIYRILAHRC